MRRVALVLLPVVFVTILVEVACGGVSLTGTGLSGTKWKGGNIMDNGVTLRFTSDTRCKLHTSFMGSGTGTYSVSGNQVSVTLGKDTYVFLMNGNLMEGNLFGAGVSLAKQE